MATAAFTAGKAAERDRQTIRRFRHVPGELARDYTWEGLVHDIALALVIIGLVFCAVGGLMLAVSWWSAQHNPVARRAHADGHTTTAVVAKHR